MQGAEIEDEGSVLKYMTKSEIEEQHSSLLIMTQRLFSSFNQHDIGITCVNFGLPSNFISNLGIFFSKAWKFYYQGMDFFSLHENLFFRHENLFSWHEKI